MRSERPLATIFPRSVMFDPFRTRKAKWSPVRPQTVSTGLMPPWLRASKAGGLPAPIPEGPGDEGSNPVPRSDAACGNREA